VNAVAPGAAAHDNHAIADADSLLDRPPRNDADAAGEDERVADVVFVEVDGAVDGGNAQRLP